MANYQSTHSGAAIDAAVTKIATVNTATLFFTNQTVLTTAFVADTTYTDFAYRASITCEGVTTDHLGDVVFGVAEALSGNYAPVCLTGNGTVTIYAKSIPSASITIPSIKAVKVVS